MPIQRYRIGNGEDREIPADDWAAFHTRRRNERMQEVQGLNNGFMLPGRGGQPGPRLRGAMGMASTRFDLNQVDERYRDQVQHSVSGGTRSGYLNDAVMRVGTGLLGRMFRNVGRLNDDNTAREMANISCNPHYRPFRLGTDPTRAPDAESARLRVATNLGRAPHYDPEENSVSLMMPEHMDQTGHEFQHADDHISGRMDLNNSDHRIASELNAFTRQNLISHELTGGPPGMFEGNTPEGMARSYQGKVNKGYTGTLDSSKAAVRKWREDRQGK